MTAATGHRTTWLCTCGERAALVSVTRSGWGIYRCWKCKRESIETVMPLVTDSTGQNAVPKLRIVKDEG